MQKAVGVWEGDTRAFGRLSGEWTNFSEETRKLKSWKMLSGVKVAAEGQHSLLVQCVCVWGGLPGGFPGVWSEKGSQW